MKKILKIILGIILIVAVILVVAWFRARKTATQQGQQSPSFRQFLGLGNGTAKQQEQTPGTGLTSDFTGPSDTTNTDTSDTGSAGGTQTSQFTSGPISPTQSNGTTTPTTSSPSGTKNSSGSSAPNSTTGKVTVIPAPNTVNAPTDTSVQTNTQCTDADTTIQFTSDEITRLNELQNRFYAIAAILHTDADVQNEVANHDEFKAKVDQVTELYNYCVAKAPLITAPLYATRITTPFWRDAARDGSGYWWNRPNNVTFIDLTNNPQDPTNPMMSQASLEQIFKLNLW